MSNSGNNKKILDRRELAEYAAALVTRIRNDNSIDLEAYKKAQEFFIEYIKDTESLNKFVEKHGYIVVDSKAH